VDPSGHHELLTGITGVGVVAVTAGDEKLLQWVLQSLEDTLVDTEIGPAWKNRTDYQELFNPNPKRPKKFQVNMGLAHGILGPLIFLAKTAKQSKLPQSLRLLKMLLPTVLNMESRYKKRPILYSLPPLQSPVTDKPTGWCYGDPALGLALIHFGTAIQDTKLVNSGVKIALRGLQRPPHAVSDRFQICHGTAGQLLICRRLYSITKHPEFLKLAERWHLKTGKLISDWLLKTTPLEKNRTRADLLYSPFGSALVLSESRRLRKLRWDALLLTDE
jgi:hypothetical protein